MAIAYKIRVTKNSFFPKRSKIFFVDNVDNAYLDIFISMLVHGEREKDKDEACIAFLLLIDDLIKKWFDTEFDEVKCNRLMSRFSLLFGGSSGRCPQFSVEKVFINRSYDANVLLDW